MHRKTILFTISRYLVYSMKFAQGIYFAKLLEPKYFGIYGFLMLIQMYLGYTSLGVPLSINMELATDSSKSAFQKIPEAFTVITIVSFLILSVGIFINWNGIILFEKYSFNDYVLITVVIASLALYRELFVDIYQVYNSLGRIAITEFLSAAAPLIIVFFFRGQELLNATLITTILTGIISLIIFVIRPPFRISISFKSATVKPLILTGITLLAANISFYLITVSVRTVVSIYYSVEVMGYYSFASSIANSTMLGINAVGWVIYPTILSKTTINESNETVIAKIKHVNDIYITLSFLTVYVAIAVLPALFYFLPKYEPAEQILVILLLSQALICTAFTYSTMAYARKKHIEIAKLSFIALIIVCISSFLIALLKLDYFWQGMAIFVGILMYVISIIKIGTESVGQKISTVFFTEIFSPGTIASMSSIIIGCMTGYISFGIMLGSIIYLTTQFYKIKKLIGFVLERI